MHYTPLAANGIKLKADCFILLIFKKAKEMYELKKGTNDCLFIYKDKTPIAGFHDENYAKLFYDFLNKKDQKCENCDIGKPVICEKCYEIESNFRESY